MAIEISGVNNNDKIVATDGTIDVFSGTNISGVVTATSFAGNLTGDVTGNLTGNVNASSNLLLQIGGSEKFRVGSSGQLGIGGANYGNSGQVLTSGGSGSAVSWSSVDATSLKDSGGNVKIQAQASGTIFTGITTLGGKITFHNASSNPSSPQNGDTYYNSTDNALITYVNGAWLVAAGEGRIVSSGSTAVYTVGGQKYLSHTITSSGIVTVTGNNVIVDYLLVAGGGGGGCLGGGGGAGGVLTGTAKKLEVGDYNVTIGGGGLNGGDAVTGATGGNTTAFGLTALGGGGGGSHDGGSVSVSGTNGGSGGGGSDNNNSYGPGSGTSGQGNNGGNGSPTYLDNYRGGGGGGGAGGVGLAYNVLDNGNRGNGGIGALNSYETGSNNYYAGGGGKSAYGGASDNNAGDGGHGGGGGGSHAGGGGGGAGDAGLASANSRQGSAGSVGSSTAGGNGGVNTGGGAGSNAWQKSGGASGGSGIIVIRYKIT
tara:strand:+ start:341 stop:1792 length:1452 start_codon:yes stop_codon:yes gene_type:complete